MHLHGEGLKADGGVQLVFLHVGAALGKRLRVDDLVVLAEAQIDDALPVARGMGHKFGRGEHVVADLLDLPEHRIADAQTVDRAVKALDAGPDAFFQPHFRSLRLKK